MIEESYWTLMRVEQSIQSADANQFDITYLCVCVRLWVCVYVCVCVCGTVW